MEKVCAFFGHRDIYRELKPELENAVRHAIQHGCRIFWCGGYGAFDRCAAGTVHRLKREFPDIRLEWIMAYLTQSDSISGLYDRSLYPEGLETVPQRFAISKRNQWMVKNCDCIIACVDHCYGGAYTAYAQAEKMGKVLANLGILRDIPHPLRH